MGKNFGNKIKEKVMLNQYLFSGHANDEAEAENISLAAVVEAILNGELIEDYPDDKRGHSCLMFGYSSTGRPIHAKCGLRENKALVCTVYEPNLSKIVWMPDFRSRIGK